MPLPPCATLFQLRLMSPFSPLFTVAETRPKSYNSPPPIQTRSPGRESPPSRACSPSAERPPAYTSPPRPLSGRASPKHWQEWSHATPPYFPAPSSQNESVHTPSHNRTQRCPIAH